MPENNYIKNLSRKDYITKAHEILVEEDVSAISIRRLAKELGCSSTSLYRYFVNIEELLFYAQLGFLKDYVEDLQNHEKLWTNIWEMYIGIWECFARQAFKTPRAFNCIFFGSQKENLPEALQEFYQMYPEGIQIVSEYLQPMLQEGTFEKRDYYMALRCVKEGVITLEHAKSMNELCVYCFKGVFKGVLDEGVDDIENTVEDLIKYITEIVIMYASDPLNLK